MVIDQILGTLQLRPYVFLFLLVYLASAWSSIGGLRTGLFTLISFAVAYTAEWSSTRYGIPFGFYEYTGATKGRELFLLNVPFMDTLSFTFLTYTGYTMAVFFAGRSPAGGSPSGRDKMDALRLRTSWKVWALATFFFVLVDVVVDPLAVRGDRWFLGHLFDYRHSGWYFGVPISNFVGWGVVGGVSFYLMQRSDRFLTRKGWGNPHFPSGDLRDFLGPGLYFGVVLFNLSITFWIGEILLGLIGLLLYLPVVYRFVRSC